MARKEIGKWSVQTGVRFFGRSKAWIWSEIRKGNLRNVGDTVTKLDPAECHALLEARGLKGGRPGGHDGKGGARQLPLIKETTAAVQVAGALPADTLEARVVRLERTIRLISPPYLTDLIERGL